MRHHNAEVDRLCEQASVDDAVQVWAAHDTNLHALSRWVGGDTQAQHWSQDLLTSSRA